MWETVLRACTQGRWGWVGDVGPLNIRKIVVPRAKGERAELPPILTLLS